MLNLNSHHFQPWSAWQKLKLERIKEKKNTVTLSNLATFAHFVYSCSNCSTTTTGTIFKSCSVWDLFLFKKSLIAQASYDVSNKSKTLSDTSSPETMWTTGISLTPW